jgi:hypothetical protein
MQFMIDSAIFLDPRCRENIGMISAMMRGFAALNPPHFAAVPWGFNWVTVLPAATGVSRNAAASWRERLATIITLAIAVFLGIAEPALACSCRAVPLDEVMAASDYVFEGTVIDSRIDSDPSGRPASLMVVTVDHSLKGGLTGTVRIYSPAQIPACGVRWPVGTKGRFAASGNADFLTTNNCRMYNINRGLLRD